MDTFHKCLSLCKTAKELFPIERAETEYPTNLVRTEEAKSMADSFQCMTKPTTIL